MSDDFVPGNDLEEALVRAATDPAARSEFYRRVIEGELLFLTPDPPGATSAPSAGSMVNLLSWEGPAGSFVPCFSSPARVREVVEKMGDPGSYLALPGRSAFQMLAQIPAEAFLNPGLGYGKRFVPKEIRKIADGTIFQAFTEGPAAPPRALTNRSSQEFSTDLLDESTSPSFRTDRVDPDFDGEPPTPPAETVRPPIPERSRPATPVPAAHRAPVAAAASPSLPANLPSNLPPWPEPAARPMAGSMPAAAAAPTGSSRLRLQVPVEDQVTPPPSPSSPSIPSSAMPAAAAGSNGNGAGTVAHDDDEAPTEGPVEEPPRRKPWWKFW